MASQTLTDYERRRLENIKRNDEMMASLKLQCRAQELSSATKRNRVEAKAYKAHQSKKPKPQAPVELRRSLRTRRIPPDSSSAGGVEDDLSPNKTSKSPAQSKPSPSFLGPLSMKDANSGDSFDRQLIDTIMNMSENTPLSCSIKKELFPIKWDTNSRGAITGSSKNDRFTCSVKEEVCLIKKEFSGDGSSENEPFCCSVKEEVCSMKKEFSGNGSSENEPFCCSVKEEVCSMKKEFSGNRSSDGPIKLEKTAVKMEAEGDLERTPLNDSMKRELDKNGASYSTVTGTSENAPLSSLDLQSLRLKPDNIARVVPGRILNVCFFPTTYRLFVVAGNKFGNVGFWDVDSQEGEGNGIYLYRPHSAPISGIVFQSCSLSKVFTSCYDGLIRLLDVEKESFDLVYSSEDSIFSLSQHPHDAKTLYFGEGQGGLNIWDERAGKSSSSLMLHEQRINSIDFSPVNNNLMATSSTDGTACIWDVRSINANKPKSLKIVDHKRAVHSAYFSPSGNCLATTSVSDEVGVLRGVEFADMSMIHHNNCTGRWISSFRAIWGWDDSYIFIGNMRRGVDVISTTQRRTVMTLESPHLSAIPCRFATHPYKVGVLAGATSGGQVYIWTSS